MAGEKEICNVALTLMGAETIRSFREDNKRARACESAYPFSRDTLLGIHYWTFAREIPKKLAPDPNVTHPWYQYSYQIPSNCYTPYYVDRERVHTDWELYGNYICTNLPEVYLQYTKLVEQTGLFSAQFTTALTHAIAGNIVYAVVQDKGLRIAVRERADIAILTAQAYDARIGNTYKKNQQKYSYDSFNNPGFDPEAFRSFPWPVTS